MQYVKIEERIEYRAAKRRFLSEGVFLCSFLCVNSDFLTPESIQRNTLKIGGSADKMPAREKT